MTHNILKSRGKVCRLMNNREEDEYNCVFSDNYMDILEIVMGLVCLQYGCDYIWGCNVGKCYVWGEMKVVSQVMCI
jgi:hypothetical protein